jgi:hypothetical protein
MTAVGTTLHARVGLTARTRRLVLPLRERGVDAGKEVAVACIVGVSAFYLLPCLTQQVEQLLVGHHGPL